MHKGNQFSRHIDAPPGHAECLCFRPVVKQKFVVQAGVWQLPGYALPDALQVAGNLIFFNYQEVALQLLADNLAQFLLLLRCEQQF